jgi:hypothetical protein
MLDKDTLQAISISVTVILAFVGYIIAHWNNIRLENRKAQIKFITEQVQNLYGPLLSLSAASKEAWLQFRSRCRPGGAFFSSPPPTEDDLANWRLWMSDVFMPINLKMEAAIIENAHLIEGDEMPKAFSDLIAHVEVYKIVIKNWEKNNFAEHTSYLNYPDELDDYVSKIFLTLKRRQMALIGNGGNDR